MQTGRSMIEMLGVLAIIGVLSIGGLYSYQQVRNYLLKNQILDVFHKIDFETAMQCPSEEDCAMKIPGFLCRHGLCDTKFSFFTKASWDYLVLGEKSPYNYLSLRWLPNDVCAAIAHFDFPRLKSILVGNGYIQGTNTGKLTEKQKQWLAEQCFKDPYSYSETGSKVNPRIDIRWDIIK